MSWLQGLASPSVAQKKEERNREQKTESKEKKEKGKEKDKTSTPTLLRLTNQYLLTLKDPDPHHKPNRTP